jgi:hypothetical protein
MCDVQVMDLGIRAFMLVLSQNPGRYGHEQTCCSCWTVTLS